MNTLLNLLNPLILVQDVCPRVVDPAIVDVCELFESLHGQAVQRSGDGVVSTKVPANNCAKQLLHTLHDIHDNYFPANLSMPTWLTTAAVPVAKTSTSRPSL